MLEHVVIFLQDYRDSLGSKRQIFLENCFAYTIHDIVEVRNDHKKSSSITFQKISGEIHNLEERHETRKFLNRLLNRDSSKIMKILEPYLILFYS